MESKKKKGTWELLILCNKFILENEEWKIRYDEEKENQTKLEQNEEKLIRLEKVKKLKEKSEQKNWKRDTNLNEDDQKKMTLSSLKEEEKIKKKKISDSKSTSWKSWRGEDGREHRMPLTRNPTSSQQEETSPEEETTLQEEGKEREMRLQRVKQLKGKFELIKLCKNFMQENSETWNARRLERKESQEEKIADWELEMRLRRASRKKVEALLIMEKTAEEKRKG